MDVIIYHSPACGTSRNALELIRHAGIEPHVVEYPKTPPPRVMGLVRTGWSIVGVFMRVVSVALVIFCSSVCRRLLVVSLCLFLSPFSPKRQKHTIVLGCKF